MSLYRSYVGHLNFMQVLKPVFVVGLLLVSFNVSAVEGLWPNSAFSEPKQAAQNSAQIVPPQLTFRAKQNRLQGYSKPNDQAFYVLSTGGKDFPVAKLHLYQLNPFKLAKTVELPQLPSPFGRYEDASVLPIPQTNHVLIYNVKSLILFDYERGQIIRKREFKDYSKGVVLQNNQAVVFFKNPMKPSDIGFKVYSASNLNLVAKSQFKGQTFGSDYRGNRYSWFSALAGNMIEIPRDMAVDPQVVIYDPQTLKPSLIINHRDKQRYSMNNQTFYHVAPDFSKLFITTLYEQHGAYDFTELDEPESAIALDNTQHIEVNLKTQVINFDLPQVPESAIEMPLGHIYFQGLSESERFVWIDGVFLIDKKHNKTYQFHQFPDGEALFTDFNSDKIMTTPNALKHLSLKDQYGKLTPLDQTTLEANQVTIE